MNRWSVHIACLLTALVILLQGCSLVAVDSKEYADPDMPALHVFQPHSSRETRHEPNGRETSVHEPGSSARFSAFTGESELAEPVLAGALPVGVEEPERPKEVEPAPGGLAEATGPKAIAAEPVKTLQAEAASEAPVIAIPVLNYHSIGKKPGSTLVLDPELLASQMAYLAKEGYTPVTMADFMLILERKSVKPDKPVLLTFDDGYTDNYELAMPILKQYGFPATLFMSPGAVGEPGYVTWEQAGEMKEAGWDIQPHGMTHPRLSKLSAARQREEITEASRLIEEKLGVKSVAFCYPYGDFNKETLAILKEQGFRYAFTIEQGLATSRQAPLQLKRIYVNGQDSLKQWASKLDG
ncbi:polysaccharide deacetylase family protein [Paenibacillus puerhi]|uniref:polysaccharide deacetylase family protein n=1 Tax=Paenibacillus puerhi TaxID=2692622 RepID=UPI001F41878E|nr:polysaccharide deacetylase family protein [Paenibacillus puerhi]